MATSNSAFKSVYNFSAGKSCFYCGRSTVTAGNSHVYGLCQEYFRLRSEDISNGHQTNRLKAEQENPESFYNQVYKKQQNGN